jgi:hypothetical protein
VPPRSEIAALHADLCDSTMMGVAALDPSYEVAAP